ncbi:YafY family protein [Winogradskya consettensis]|uniref:DeoR family transcriptional regulator n=1 Tax=Winogradskya consettensis TaxID=113560 RepID=A0A919SPT9_9ACTN|nr:YafY family protein [Actinoplanes consettensis]GIM76156.1 DeoR family transcriptional regulator [Actinoplanes consettensis]
MISTSARLLRLVTLLSSRPSWTNAELAARMEVTERTVRRDVARLRELGYAVESDPGPLGGYRLEAGNKVPPLALDDDEAFAVAVALRETALNGTLGSDQPALSALLKLQQVLPRRIADRLAAVDATVTHAPRATTPQIAPEILLHLASACRRGERASLVYRDREGQETVREVDPYRLVQTGRRWYFVARDVAKGEWRTFRADRVATIEPTGRPAELGAPPDPAELVRLALPAGVYPVYCTVRIAMPFDEARKLIPTTMGVHKPDGAAVTIVEIGGYDADELARYLLGLATPLRVLTPESVREAMRRRATEVLVTLDR